MALSEKSEKKIIILGAGPAGLAAAYRLREQGFFNFTLYEKSSGVGGLSGSRRDAQGFMWDLGGHVLFSHFSYFDGILEKHMAGGFNELDRRAWIQVAGRRVPYPFQNHLRYLPGNMIEECVKGVEEIDGLPVNAGNFHDWIIANMGKGIARHFMIPYNLKVWSYPLEKMGVQWIAERVSPVTLRGVREHLSDAKDARWGPNASFLYPKQGGFAAPFSRMAETVKDSIVFNSPAVEIDAVHRKIIFGNGREDRYDVLITTMPLDQLCRITAGLPAGIVQEAEGLVHNSMHVVGIGVQGTVPDTHCWIYFPEERYPFTRVTLLSNYSSDVTPRGNYHSFLCECPYSGFRPVPAEGIVEKTIEGLMEAGLIERKNGSRIVSRFYEHLEYAYPVPTTGLGEKLRKINSALEENQILSRGRFGAWRYELGNSDHAVQQGKEAADRALFNTEECIFEDVRFNKT